MNHLYLHRSIFWKWCVFRGQWIKQEWNYKTLNMNENVKMLFYRRWTAQKCLPRSFLSFWRKVSSQRKFFKFSKKVFATKFVTNNDLRTQHPSVRYNICTTCTKASAAKIRERTGNAFDLVHHEFFFRCLSTRLANPNTVFALICTIKCLTPLLHRKTRHVKKTSQNFPRRKFVTKELFATNFLTRRKFVTKEIFATLKKILWKNLFQSSLRGKKKFQWQQHYFATKKLWFR